MALSVESSAGTRPNSDAFWSKLSELITHPATVGAGTLVNGLGAYIMLKNQQNTAEFGFGVLSAELSAGGAAMLAYETAKKRLAGREREQPYSKQENFTDYIHLDEEGGYQSPFLVAVVGIRHELLGLGKVIGGLREESDPDFTMPVIALPDHRSPGGLVELLGAECHWVPADDEVIDATVPLMVEGLTVPAFEYQRSLDP